MASAPPSPPATGRQSTSAAIVADAAMWHRLRRTADALYLQGQHGRARLGFRVLWQQIPAHQIPALLVEMQPKAGDPNTDERRRYLCGLHWATAARHYPALTASLSAPNNLGPRLQQAIVCFPRLPEAYLALSDLLACSDLPGAHSRNLALLDLAVRACAPLPELHWARAVLLARSLGEHERAYADLLVARRLRPSEPLYALMHSCVLVQRGDAFYTDAIDMLTDALPSQPQLAQANFSYFPSLGCALKQWPTHTLMDRAYEFIARTVASEPAGDPWQVILGPPSWHATRHDGDDRR